MKSTKEIVHAFIVRIWIEPRELKDAEPIWRGVIEDVGAEKPVYFDRFEKLSAYFDRFLEGIGVKVHNLRK